MTTATPAAPAEAAAPPRRAMFIVFLVVFIDLLGFGIVLPLLPRYVDEFVPHLPAAVPDALKGTLIGVMYSSFSLMQFLLSPVWGRLSDRVGRRPVLLVGLAGSVVFYALFAYASTLPGETHAVVAMWLMLLSRVGAGVAGATVSTAAAVIADCTTKEGRSKGMALIGAAFGIGFTFGPLIALAALVVFPESKGGPGWLASGLSAVALVLGWRLLPETRRPGAAGERHRNVFDLKSYADTLRTPTVGLLVFAFFLTIFAFANFEGTLSLLTKEAFGYGDRANFGVFAFIGASLMVAQGAVYRRLVGKVGEAGFMRLGLGMMLASMAGLAAVTAGSQYGVERAVLLAGFYLAAAVGVFGFAFVNPSVQAIISQRSDPDRQGEVMGVNQSAGSLARILGPVVGLTLFTATAGHALPYATASALLLVVLVLLPRLAGRE